MTPALAWLLQQIEADEHTARAAIHDDDNVPEPDSEGRWHARDYGHEGLALHLGPDDEYALPERTAATRHITVWSPARVLGECRAKRKQIEMLEEVRQLSHLLPVPMDVGLAVEALCTSMFVPFADRPGYPL